MSLDDEIRRQFHLQDEIRRQRELAEEVRSHRELRSFADHYENLFGRDIGRDAVKAMLDAAQQRRELVGLSALRLPAFELYRQLHRDLLGGIKSSYDAARQVAEQARQSMLGSSIIDEALKWERMKQELRGRQDLLGLYDGSLLEWQRHLGTLTSAIQAASREPWSHLIGSRTLETLSAPAFAYSSFSRRTVQRLESAPPRDVPALQASVVLADQELTVGTAFGATMLAPAEHDAERSDEAPVPSPPETIPGTPPITEGDGDVPPVDLAFRDQQAAAITLFDTQQTELLAAGVDHDAEYDALLEVAPSARRADRARQLVLSVLEIEHARRLTGDEAIFERSIAALRAAVLLPVHDVRDQSGLGDAVDHLYFLVYEGSGALKRITPSLLGGTVCEPVFKLKHLRNKWLRHDPEHGPASDQKKSFAQLSEAFAYFGTSTKPRTQEEFAALYDSILARMNEFTDALFNAVLQSRGVS